MKTLKALFILTRPINALLAGIGIVTGFFYTNGNLFSHNLLFLVFAGSSALAFGNVINDLMDIESDKISHPDRPLPKGDISVKHTFLFLIFLGICSVFSGFIVSDLHGIATLIPLFILIIYSIYLKGTPLAGNITVSILVAYTLIFGALNGNYEVLIAPSILAFLASFSREIVKDLADKEGDEFAGLTTTAKLKPKIINLVIFIVAVLFLILSPLPILLKQVGLIYAIIVGISVVPLHIYWIHLYLKRDFTKSAKLLKYQMFLGLLALILDKLI